MHIDLIHVAHVDVARQRGHETRLRLLLHHHALNDTIVTLGMLSLLLQLVKFTRIVRVMMAMLFAVVPLMPQTLGVIYQVGIADVLWTATMIAYTNVGRSTAQVKQHLLLIIIGYREIAVHFCAYQ